MKDLWSIKGLSKATDWRNRYVFKVIPFVGKIFTKSAVPYSYLPVSIETYYKPGQFMRLMVQCGFSDVSVHSLSLGIATIYRGKKQ